MKDNSSKLRSRSHRVHFVGSFPGELPAAKLPEVAFAGRSNVGKSSAINTLLGQKGVARVSQTPGRTQAVNLFRVDEQLMFADLPGYGFAKVPQEVRQRWKPMIENYLGSRSELKMVVVLVDSRRTAQEMDQALIASLKEFGIRTLVVATKIDKLSKSKRRPILNKLALGLGVGRSDLVPFSSTKREGIGQVWRRIYAASGVDQ